MILRSFGARGLREHLARHIALAGTFASWVDAHPDFERLAPVPFSVVCFRWNPRARRLSAAELDDANQQIVDEVNRVGDVFVSTARVRGAVAIRVAIGHLRTSEAHLVRAWHLILERSAGIA